MKPANKTTELKTLIKDARRALWVFAAINITVLLFFIIDGIYNEFVFVLLFLQVLLLVVWLIPVFIYHVLVKKLRVKVAVYKALASYKEAISHVSW